MIIKGLMDENFQDYKLPSMYIAFPSCTFKCEKDCGKFICANRALAEEPGIEVSAEQLVERYLKNPITHAVVLGGLEPFDSFDFVLEFIDSLRRECEDDVVIYSGYKEEEIQDKIKELLRYKNIIVKFGRFIPDDEPIFDKILEVTLASKNQYAKILK